MRDGVESERWEGRERDNKLASTESTFGAISTGKWLRYYHSSWICSRSLCIVVVGVVEEEGDVNLARHRQLEDFRIGYQLVGAPVGDDMHPSPSRPVDLVHSTPPHDQRSGYRLQAGPPLLLLPS